MDMNKEENKNHMNKKDHRKSSIKFTAERLQLLSVITICKTSMRIELNRNITERHKLAKIC